MTSSILHLVVSLIGILLLLLLLLLPRAVNSSSDDEACVVDETCRGIGWISPTLDRIRERRRLREEAEAMGGDDGVDDVALIVKEAMEAHSAGRAEEAILAFSRLREMRHDDVSVEMAQAEMYHGIVLAQQYRGVEALECWSRAISIQEKASSHRPEDVEAFRGQVGMLIYRAAEHFSAAANNEPGNSSNLKLHFDAAKLCNAIGDTVRATNHLEAVLSLDPDDSIAMYVLGTLREREGKTEEANRLKQTAIELQPGNIGGAMISAARSCEENDLEACARRYLVAYEYAYEGRNMQVASRAVSSAVFTLLQYKGEAGLDESRKIGEKAVSRGVLNAPMQVPGNLILGLSPARAYHDDSREWEVVRVLEEHADEIRDEVLAVYKAGKLHGRYEYDSVSDLAVRGHWAEVNIIRQGMPQSRTLELLPITSRVVLSISDAATMVHGGSKISVIDGGSLVRPHTGSTNSRLRVHMGITVPNDCGIIVDGEERRWVEGKCMVIDDSFVHSVWQNSTQVRIVLIVDIWHPGLNETGREATMSERQIKWYRAINRMMTDGTWLEAASEIQEGLILSSQS
ncbi:hypothetical protein ACHAXA_009481 [Cyclostephanos tholiformis]|uniref:Aspartyl/asparaginy/proline hydroxylase domain-containing protein n=1 Tax=Cyclostephanos tholiformis TaxID=382380 RepID=A0ABD3RFU6_9STRA